MNSTRPELNVDITKSVPRAFGDYIIIKAERENVSGIIIPNLGTYEEKKNWLREKCTIFSVGENVKGLEEGNLVYAVVKGVRFEELNEIMKEDPEKVAYFIVKKEDISVVL